MPTEVLALSGLTKTYGDVTAVAGLDLTLYAGEVVALVGENGAGKSTVVNMIAGMTEPDTGTIHLQGDGVRFNSPRDALERGIGVVHQHYSLVSNFTVAETFALGVSPMGRLDRKGLRAQVRALAGDVGISLDPDAVIGSLDVAGQQRVEILKALSRDIKVLILDEPTAVLTSEDSVRLFEVVARLRSNGVAVLLITHKLADVFAVCDRAAVMHAGKLVADRPVGEFTAQSLVSLMIAGRDGEQAADALAHVLTEDFEKPESAASASVTKIPGRTAGVRPENHAATCPATPSLTVSDVTLRRQNGSAAVAGVSFDLHAGEILAVAGVDGNGQAELVQALAGLQSPAEGYMTFATLDSRDKSHWTPRALRRAGIAHVPDDRRRYGIIEELPLSENLLLSHFFGSRYRRYGFLDRRRAVEDTAAAIGAYEIRTTGADQHIGRLSGGNQQKLVLARELLAEPSVILAAHPSRGLDVRTIAFVQDTLRERSARGAAILLVSADLGEIRGLADRVIVFAAGRARGPVPVSETTHEGLGAWMAGH